MSQYKYDNQDIYYLLNNPSYSNTPYNPFPLSDLPIYGSNIDKPYFLNYKVSSADLNNSNTALNNFYTNTNNSINYAIPNNTANFKHISAYCYGGGGGGGGGGGAGTDNLAGGNHSKGGSGGNGAVGGYAAVVQYPIDGPIAVTIGASGINGGGGAKSGNGSGQAGGAGGAGGVTTLKINNITVLQAYGGGFGKGGGGGSGNGGTGSQGTTNLNTTNSTANGGTDKTTNANSPAYPYWPPNGSIAGNGGAGANWGNSADPGTPGSKGYAQIWFSYRAT